MNNLVLFASLSICLILSIEVQGDTDSEFIRAALDETPDRVKELFEKGANISASDKDGKTALMFASNNGRYETVDFLIENGADVNAKDNNGETPLMFASALDYSKVIKLLIEKGADVNAKDNGGWSALIYAAYNGRDQTVRLLLRKDADNEYALKYATEALNSQINGDFLNVYVRPDTSNVSGYQTAINTINNNDTFWQRLKSYIE